MRLHELNFPLCMIGRQYLFGPVERTSEFDSYDPEEIRGGALDDIQFIDSLGMEYSVEGVEISDVRWWERLFQGRTIRMEVMLKATAELTLESFRTKVIQHLQVHRDWQHNGEEQWSISEVEKVLISANSFPEAIRLVGWFSEESYVSYKGNTSDKFFDSRSRVKIQR
jgi:hypothetical protein